MIVQNRHSRILLREFLRSRTENTSRTRSLKGRGSSGKMARLPCKEYLKGVCTTPFWEKWRPPEYLFYKSENGCRFRRKCCYAQCQVVEQPSKKSRKNADNSAAAILQLYDNWVVYHEKEENLITHDRNEVGGSEASVKCIVNTFRIFFFLRRSVLFLSENHEKRNEKGRRRKTAETLRLC